MAQNRVLYQVALNKWKFYVFIQKVEVCIPDTALWWESAEFLTGRKEQGLFLLACSLGDEPRVATCSRKWKETIKWMGILLDK